MIENRFKRFLLGPGDASVGAVSRSCGNARPAYHPAVLLKINSYGYLNRVCRQFVMRISYMGR